MCDLAAQEFDMTHRPAPKPAAATIDDYIAAFPNDVQARLQEVRRAIAKAAPQAVEAISYRIPTFKQNGRYLIYFAGFKTHIGLYPVHADGAGFSAEMARYASGKATLKFPLGEPLPLGLIAKVIEIKLRDATTPKRDKKT
jgi:uncharacterized protein YdhG (YjbR/CyaY superfamily)